MHTHMHKHIHMHTKEEGTMPGKIIAICNWKGGCGKTSVSIALANGLNRMGKKALLIDLDPQCNATDTYRGSYKGVTTLYDVLVDGVDAKEAVQHLEAGDLIACDPLLRKAEASMSSVGKENILRKALRDLKKEYDFIILDCPPQTGILQNNAMVAADSCIIPISPDRYTVIGLAALNENIRDVRENTMNENLSIEGLLMVRVNDQRILSKEIMDMLPEVSRMLDTKCFESTIREAEAVRRSQSEKMTIFEWEEAVKILLE